MAKRSADSVSPGSVSRLLGGLLRGCRSAFACIVARYRTHVTRDARRCMGPHLARAVDAEDLAQNAFASLWNCLQKERDQPLCLGDRNDLLRLLGEITLQKIRMARRYHTRQKRDIRRTVLEADATDGPEHGSPLALLASGEPPPDWESVFQDTLAAWLADLRPELRQIVRLRLDGYTNLEIGGILGCSKRAVERHLSEVRAVWQVRAADRDGDQ